MLIRHTRKLARLLLAGVLFALMAVAPVAAQSESPGTAVLLEIKGAIGPAMSDYIVEGIEHASAGGATLIIIEMDTPGGLDSAMRDMIKAILSSTVPVVTYVSPSGSRAASAGTYILYASHIAAMAPATNLGAATPVQIGSPGGAEKPKPADLLKDGAEDKDEPDSPPASGTAMEKKAINDAVAYIRGLATLRNRNADWAERAVREAESLSAEDAHEQNVIDVIAVSTTDLLTQINGRSVEVADQEKILVTDNMIIERFEPNWRTRVLMIITDPNIAYMLLLAGIYGLIFEGYNPGALVPGVVGAICLLLALFAFQVLPVNFAGLALIILGVTLIVAEAFMPSFGALGLGGIAAFVFGSVILIDSEVPGFQVSRALVGGIALAAATLLMGLVVFLMRNIRRPVVSGMEAMIGSIGKAIESFERSGPVFLNGERWNARSQSRIEKGGSVRVIAIHGLELEIEPNELTGEQ
jgi:membrane-bound serine protease (ClpP class)